MVNYWYSVVPKFWNKHHPQQMFVWNVEIFFMQTCLLNLSHAMLLCSCCPNGNWLPFSTQGASLPLSPLLTLLVIISMIRSSYNFFKHSPPFVDVYIFCTSLLCNPQSRLNLVTNIISFVCKVSGLIYWSVRMSEWSSYDIGNKGLFQINHYFICYIKWKVSFHVTVHVYHLDVDVVLIIRSLHVKESSKKILS